MKSLLVFFIVLLITQEIVPFAHEERNLQIREEEIKNESQQYYSRQTTPILGLGRDFAEWYRSKYGYGRLEVQDIEDLGLYSIQSEYEEFKSQFTRWCYDRHGLKEASTRKIEKLIKEFESYEQEQEEYPIREQIEPKFMIQDNFSFATSFKPESKEKKKNLFKN